MCRVGLRNKRLDYGKYCEKTTRIMLQRKMNGKANAESTDNYVIELLEVQVLQLYVDKSGKLDDRDQGGKPLLGEFAEKYSGT